ncbi:MAG: Vitamin B12 import ATP-binding protein BtuD [Chroococcidiopsis cubana SAG 39.79]|uniref:ABC transporter permease n=1 Tax=Chroococcidiopsis cubana SAG 39.79 TaxID=388085 RepID=A0AB37UKJ5_9CYAN|nr:ABC transporter ATP-binding protein [Chroococcidiopsis cubana]MDZ4875259.1 Vitamin B12 import ATP-binding protein BtuD [Chroococcidiopsis cubana SAG 39.79]RUT11862.1 ABC transporter permease [Chroococcidiopsis cubana SAG 39.79]
MPKPRNILQRLLTQLKQGSQVFQYTGRAVGLVWQTSRALTFVLAIVTVVAGLLPAAIAYVGKLIVDGVVLAHQSGLERDRLITLGYLGIEAILVALLAGSQRGLTISQSLLRVLLGQKVNLLILQKALTLDLIHFEDSEFYDKMTRARREASSRPLSLVSSTFSIVQNAISLVTYGGLLLQFSFWAVIVLLLSAVPAFIAETRFAGQAFRLFRWRAPETREQTYLETLIAREDFAKEVKLYQLGAMLLERYRSIFNRLYGEDRDLTLRRGVWGYLLSLLSTAAFYLAYAWIVVEAIAGRLSLGDMTMYLMVFRQGQTTFSSTLTSIGGMYEDNLYLSNLYEFLEQPISLPKGKATQGLIPGDGIRFENVSFIYPGSNKLALNNVSFRIRAGEKLAIVGENGSGKTTLIKLLTRLYNPDKGRILLDGLDLQAWDLGVLQRRIGVIFQDFIRYQFTVGENIGVGDVTRIEDRDLWQVAADKGMALPLIEQLPDSFQTQLGKWFRGGQELSGGQWQKIALSRAFMRNKADILVLDEPTAAMDAEAEFQIFERLRSLTQNQMAILISHRFSTVRMADKIMVLSGGKVVEQGTHEELLQSGGRYAHLFRLQAAGYQ